MTRINPPSAGALQDAVHILLDRQELDYETTARAGAAVAQVLTLYWSEEWPAYMERRPDHVSEELWEKWGLRNEIVALRRCLADAYERIGQLRAQRDDARCREVATDADIAAFVRSAAKESASIEQDLRLCHLAKFELQDELRSAVADRDRFQALAIERAETSVPDTDSER